MAPSYSAPSTHPHCCPYREPGHPATSTLSTASCSVRPHSSAARWGVKATTEPIAGTSTLTQYAATDWPASPCLSPWEEPHCQRAAPLAGSREWMEIRSPVLWAWGGIKEAPGWGAVAHGVWGGIWVTVLSGYPRQQPLVPAERGRSPARPSIGPPSSCLPALHCRHRDLPRRGSPEVQGTVPGQSPVLCPYLVTLSGDRATSGFGPICGSLL